MVSEWMAQGNIMEFVKTDNTADRLELVCFFRSFPSFVTDDNTIPTA